MKDRVSRMKLTLELSRWFLVFEEIDIVFNRHWGVVEQESLKLNDVIKKCNLRRQRILMVNINSMFSFKHCKLTCIINIKK